MKKKIMLVIIAIVLIMVVIALGFGKTIIEKYSYSKERADLNAYFEIRDENDVAIVLHDTIIEERARMSNGVCYLDIDTVHKYFNKRFYEDRGENLLLYTVPDEIIRNEIGTGSVVKPSGDETFDYPLSYYEGDILYVAVDYIKKYTNFSYEVFGEPSRIQMDFLWEEKQVADISKDTAVRVLGGIKSDILTDVAAGDTVCVLEQMETWCKVKTADSMIGYVENKQLENMRQEAAIPVTDYTEPEYTSQVREHKINLGWHVIAGIAGNDTLNEVTANAKELNVISPTWFKINDNNGGFVSFATQQYVDAAHNKGLEVWALVENIEYEESIDIFAILSSTTTRGKLIENLMNEVLQYGIDGINVDLEKINVDTGEHFIQFIRELSIPCRANGIVLSVDNYVPYHFNDHYDRTEQGIVADYVVIMGYDEHYAGSEEAGSVASIDYVTNGIAGTVEQVPPYKIINAVPFYTRIWETKGGEISSQAVGMDMAKEWIVNHNIDTIWDEETCQNYGEYLTGSTLYQVWLEDKESLSVKFAVMDNYGIAGVAIWRLGYETPDVWDAVEEYMTR